MSIEKNSQNEERYEVSGEEYAILQRIKKQELYTVDAEQMAMLHFIVAEDVSWSSSMLEAMTILQYKDPAKVARTVWMLLAEFLVEFKDAGEAPKEVAQITDLLVLLYEWQLAVMEE